MTQSNSSQLFMSADEVSTRLEISRFELYRRLKTGELPRPDAIVGRTFGWKPETVAQLMFEQRGVPSSAA